MATPAQTARFIRDHLPVSDLPGLGVRLHLAAPASRVGRLAGEGPAPYWAYAWAGGLALAHHLVAHPALVRGRRVLDLGSGSGLVAIVAARLGAAEVKAAETDAHGRAAIALNAALNGVALQVEAEASAGADIVLAGDVFYAPDVAARALAWLEAAANAGAEVLIGDPGRADLPRGRLVEVARYPVADFGATDAREAAVFTLPAVHRRPSS